MLEMPDWAGSKINHHRPCRKNAIPARIIARRLVERIAIINTVALNLLIQHLMSPLAVLGVFILNGSPLGVHAEPRAELQFRQFRKKARHGIHHRILEQEQLGLPVVGLRIQSFRFQPCQPVRSNHRPWQGLCLEDAPPNRFRLLLFTLQFKAVRFGLPFLGYA